MPESSRAPLRIVGEFMVIVAGVSVGLFADDWRQERELREQERGFLVALVEDLRADSVELEEVRASGERWDRGALELRRVMDGSPASEDSVEVLIGGLTGFSTYQPIRAAYERMKAAGRMDLLDDPELQTEVTSYYENVQAYMQDVNNDLQRTLWDEWRAVYTRHLETAFGPDSETHWVVDDAGGLQWRIHTDWDAFRTDPEVRAYLRQLGLFGANGQLRFRSAIEANVALREQIRTVLESS